ncbi:MAG: GIY-YIG nuclease family protein [Ilumatobacteraceae bacterium]
MADTYITNELGDIYEIDIDGLRAPVDPAVWGWAREGGAHDHADIRRSIDTLRALPGFIVDEQPDQRLVPGPRHRYATWGRFEDGAAPPVALRSKNGTGTLAYLNRLSEAVGHVALRLPVDPDRSPMLIHDFVGGRLFRATYERPAPAADGRGTVYVLEDGSGIKIGYTQGPVAKRIAELQTGNSRRITTIAEAHNATPELEALLHAKLSEWNVTGEWFARDHLVAQAAAAGGFGVWLQRLAGHDRWPVTVHPPYR